MSSRLPGFFEGAWPSDWRLILVGLVRYASGGFREVEAMTLDELRFWHNAASEMEKAVAAEIGR